MNSNITEQEYNILRTLVQESLEEAGLGKYIGSKAKKLKDDTIGLVGRNITKKVQRASAEAGYKITNKLFSRFTPAINILIDLLESHNTQSVEEGIGDWAKENILDVFVDTTFGEIGRYIDRKVNAKIAMIAGNLVSSKSGIDIANYFFDQLDSAAPGMLGSNNAKQRLSKILDSLTGKQEKIIKKLGSASNYIIADSFLQGIFINEAAISEQNWAKEAKNVISKLTPENIDQKIKELGSSKHNGLLVNPDTVNVMATKLYKMSHSTPLGKMLVKLAKQIGHELGAPDLDPNKSEEDYTDEDIDKIKASKALHLQIMKIIAYGYITTMLHKNVLSRPIMIKAVNEKMRELNRSTKAKTLSKGEIAKAKKAGNSSNTSTNSKTAKAKSNDYEEDDEVDFDDEE